MPFELAHDFTGAHLIVQSSDLALGPPESYLYIQDGLIISCGVLYALCYLFYMIRTYKDQFCAGPIEFLAGTMSYELYYAFVMTSSTFEFVCFLMWFLFDVTFVTVAILAAYPKDRQKRVAATTAMGVIIGLASFHLLCRMFPDEKDEVTAYWTGWLLELPIGWGSLLLLLQRADTKGQSLEIWSTRFLGVHTANGVFVWRYLNVPQNWAYVASWPSIVLVTLTMLPEFVYPFVFVRVHYAALDQGKKKSN